MSIIGRAAAGDISHLAYLAGRRRLEPHRPRTRQR
jgi:hypothetical protein